MGRLRSPVRPDTAGFDAVEMIAHLVDIARTPRTVARPGGEDDDARRSIARGTGSARAAVGYSLGERGAAGKLHNGVDGRRGDPNLVAAVADSRAFEHKYPPPA